MPRVHFANSSPTRVPVVPTQMHDIPDHLTPQDQDMLSVSPPDYLKFTRGDAKDSTLVFKCISSAPVTYKIQTTSPEKFRVRPRCGILYPGEMLAVSILLKPEHLLSDNGKDKFLIMCMPSMDIKSNQVAEFWKKLGQQSANMEQHRLYCTYNDDGATGGQIVSNGVSNSGVSTVDKKGDYVNGGSAETRKLEKQLRNTQILQIVTLVFLLILSAVVIYLLKLQMCGDEGCLSKDAAADSVDFATCAKGKADL